jgi:hypothetical protein
MNARLITHSLLFGAACLTGLSLTFAVYAYDAYIDRREASRIVNPFRITKSVNILSVNENRIHARILGAGFGNIQEISFTVNEATKIERRDLIIENEVIVGLTPAIVTPLSAARAGEPAFVRLILQGEDLVASYILLNDPLTNLE